MRSNLLKLLGGILLAVGAGATLAHFAGVFSPATPEPSPAAESRFVSATAAGTDVFINEFHYDNAGTDTNEFVEVAGPTGTDLTGWSLVFYNGANDTEYRTEALAGTLADETGAGVGLTVVTLPTNGIQNGSPDGIALVDAGGAVVQFLGYEGTFTAVGGPADGLTSVDIGVSESGSTPTGFSLQLGGTGCVYEDFTWNAPADDTPGEVNNSQSFACGTAVADPLINEFVFNHTGSDDTEYIEIVGTPSTDYSAFTVIVIEGDGTGAGTIDAALTMGTTNAEGYYVSPFQNNEFENGTQTALLVEGFTGSVGDDLDTDNDGTPDNTPWVRIVDDFAVDDGGSSDQVYSSVVLVGGFDGVSFTPGGASRIPDATDTDTPADWTRNDFDLAPLRAGSPDDGEALNTPGAANELVPPPLAEIIITEIMQNPSAVSDGDGEYFELYNAGSSTVDLNGWVISDTDNDSHTINNGAPLEIAPGDYLVLGTNADTATNGGVPVDYSYGSGWFLSNGADEVILTDDSGNEIDRVEYDGGPIWPDPTGVSMSLCQLSADNNDGANWAEATSTFGDGDLGTPGAANDPCGIVEAPEVFINEVRGNKSGDETDFFEIQGEAGTSLDGLSILVISGDFEPGTIDNVVDLTGSSIPADGFFVTMNSAAASDYGITPDLVSGFSSFGSPATYLIVSDFSGAQGTDLDTNNDGVLDTVPWSAIVDSVSLTDGSGDVNYSDVVVGPDGSFPPAGAFRCGDAPTGVFDNNQLDFGSNAADTPGLSNLPQCTPTVFINEVRGNKSGDETDFFEIQGEAGTSLDGLSILVISGDFEPGTIDNVVDLTGSSIPADGFFVTMNSAAASDYGITPDLVSGFSSFGSPATYLIVSDFSGAQGTDLDTNNDGVLDTVPWSAIVDSVSLTDGSGDVNYSDVVVGPDGSFPPAGAFRCGDAPTGVFDNNQLDFGSNVADTPGLSNAPQCTPNIAKIHEIQGSGLSVVPGIYTVEAIVVGDFQEDDQLDGFFIQEENADADTDPNTSEGIFVYCGSCAVDVAVGDLVQITGEATEFFEMSQLDITGGGSVTVISSSNTLPTPATVDLPASGSTQAEATFEAVEGMLVTFSDELFVSEYFQLARYGQLVLTAEGRPRQFTDANAPSVSGYAAFLDTLETTRIILDDDNNTQNFPISGSSDTPYFWPRPGLSNDNFIRGGDSISNLTGVLHWSFAGQSGTDAWRVRPVEEAFSYEFTSNNPRTATPDDVGGSLTVASFNVLNFFTTIDETSSNSSGPCGPSGTLDCRGADSQVELERQIDKTVAAICEVNADIVGLVEIENNDEASLSTLVTALNEVDGCGPYDFVDTGFIGTDAIKVGFIYNTDTVNLVGDFAILDSSVDARFVDTKNRPALAQTFQEAASGESLTVVVNHLKSKGSDCDALGDPDLGDGQGNCNQTRTDAALAMVDWLATDPTGSGDPDFLIIGDLNSYRNEDPIVALENGGYNDLIDSFLGANAYSFVFDGQLGYLDYALANGSLLPQVTGVTEWHINADEIPVFDYNDDIADTGEAFFEEESDALPIYEPTAYRSSDHDPVIVGLNLASEEEPVTINVTQDVDTITEGEAVTYSIQSDVPSGEEITLEISLVGSGANPVDADDLASNGIFPGNLQLPYTTGDLLQFTVTPDDDSFFEPTEEMTFSVSIVSGPDNISMGTASVVTSVQDNEPDIDYTVSPDPASISEWVIGARYRSFASDGDRELFAGLPDLGRGGFTRSEVDIVWAQGANDVTFSLDRASDKLIVTVVNANGTYTLEYTDVTANLLADSKVATLDDLDIMQIALFDRDDPAEVSFTDVSFNGYPLGDFDGEGGVISYVRGFDFTQDFTVSGTINLTDQFSGSAELSRVEILVGVEEDAPEPGSITIIKDAQPDAGWLDWDFALSQEGVTLESFMLDNDFTNQDSPDRMTFEVEAGSYTLSELDAPNNWDTDVVCGAQTVAENLNGAERSVEVTVAEGEDLTCTFINKRRGQVQITKLLDADGTLDTAEEQVPVEGWQMFLYQQQDEGYVQIQPRDVFTDANGVANYTSLVPGIYAVCEASVDGYINLGATLESSPVSTFMLDGRTCVEFNSDYTEIAHVSFINAEDAPEPGSITITKDVTEGDETQVFHFSFSDGVNQPTNFSLSETGGGVPFTDLQPATYTITETNLPEGWTLDNAICASEGGSIFTNVANGVSVDLVEGDQVTCTFFNSQEPEPQNLPPTIEPIADQINTVGDSASIQVSANDPENLALRYTATGLPAGVSIDEVTGLISGTLGEAGEFSVTVTVTDSEGQTASTSFTWTVNEPEPTPTTPAPTTPAPTTPAPTTPAPTTPAPTTPAPTTPAPTEPTEQPTEPTPTEPVTGIEALEVCWIENPNGNTSAWEVTNPNPVPLIQGQPDKVVFSWTTYDAQGNVLQSAERWDQTGETRINTTLADRIEVVWYLFDNQLSEPLGMAVAFATEDYRCETDEVEVPAEPTPAPTEPTEQPTEPTPAPTEPTEQPTEPTPAPTEAPQVEVAALEVCWIENPNGNTSAWEVTNPNPVPLIQGQPDKVMFAWQVFDADGNVLQSAERWDQTGATRINTVLASHIQVTWYYFDNSLSAPLGTTMAFGVEEDRCGQ